MLLARGLFFADITIAEVGGGIDAVEREDEVSCFWVLVTSVWKPVTIVLASLFRAFDCDFL